MTGIHDSYLQDTISDIIPGYKQRVTKYAIPMLAMYGKISFETSYLACIPPENNSNEIVIINLKKK